MEQLVLYFGGRFRYRHHEFHVDCSSVCQPSSSHSGDIAEFMSSLTCLTVSVESKSKVETVYLCRVDDGLLTGRKRSD